MSGGGLELRLILQLFRDASKEVHANLRMGDLPAPKENAHLNLVAVPKELLDTANLGGPVVTRDSRAEAHLAHYVGLLSLAGLTISLCLRVPEAPVVK